MAIFRGIGGSGDATGDASNQAVIAINAANAAIAAEAQAVASAASALNSALASAASAASMDELGNLAYQNADSIAGNVNIGGEATINGITIGRGTGNLITNTAIGYIALQVNTTGYANTAIGANALDSNTTGIFNTASGAGVLTTNISGSSNSGYGVYTLYLNTTGNYNTANGLSALFSNTTGSFNTAYGYDALGLNTTGSGNTGLSPRNSAGVYAPVFNTTVENNRFCMGSTGVTNAYIQVAWTVVSDARDKTDFTPVPHGLDFVTKLKPIAYRYKMSREDVEGHGPIRYGFKAQDVLELEGNTPVIVDAEDLDKLRFNDQSMIAVMVNAIQELKAEFDAYKLTHTL